MVQLGDGFHFMEAIFTKEAVNQFRKQYSHLMMSQMRDRLLKVTKWSFQLKQRSSATCFNSNTNLGVYLIVSEFQPMPSLTVVSKQGSSCKNLFQEERIQTLLKNTRFEFTKSLIDLKRNEGSNCGFGSFTMPSMREVIYHPKSTTS